MKHHPLPLLIASAMCWLASAAPSQAVPEQGAYAEYSTSGVIDLQSVAYHGALQIDYVPTMPISNGSGTMQVLQAAARLPAPIVESALTIRGLVGYQQQWGYYNGLEDTYGGINVGLSSSLNCGDIPYVGEFLRPITFYGYGFLNRLVTAKANGQGFGTNSETLPAWGYGIQVQVPTNGAVYAGIETSSIPMELGTGAATFSGRLYFFNQYVVGYRW